MCLSSKFSVTLPTLNVQSSAAASFAMPCQACDMLMCGPVQSKDDPFYQAAEEPQHKYPIRAGKPGKFPATPGCNSSQAAEVIPNKLQPRRKALAAWHCSEGQ